MAETNPVIEDFDDDEVEVEEEVVIKPKRKWQPEYLKIVARSCTGASAKDIAAEIDRSVSHVYQVLAMEEAEEWRKTIMEKIRERTEEDLVKDIVSIKHKAVKRMKQYIDDDELFEKAPHAVMDRSMRFLEGVNVLKQKSDVTINNNTQNNANFNLPESSATSLIAGLEKANEVRQLHSGVTNQSIDE